MTTLLISIIMWIFLYLFQKNNLKKLSSFEDKWKIIQKDYIAVLCILNAGKSQIWDIHSKMNNKTVITTLWFAIINKKQSFIEFNMV